MVFPNTPSVALQMSDPADLDGRELVERIRAGDRAACERLVRRYRAGVVAMVRRACGPGAPVDDLTQEVLSLAIAKVAAGEVRDPDRLPGFVAGLARNLAREHGHKSQAHRHEELSAIAELPGGDPDALQTLLDSERASVARQVLEELPGERDRLILRRFYLSEDDKAAICADLGLTSLQFNTVVHRARQRFRELYEKAVRRKGQQ